MGINELVRGQRLAKRLKTRLQGWESSSTTTTVTEPPPSEEAGDAVIIKQLLTCFENTLCRVKNNSCSSDERKCQEYSGTSCTSSTGLAKDRRGCYKRFRKTDDSWIQDSCMLVEDGYRWRKYGQKTILNTKYLRDYFRCTHKDEQACLANKHVQRVLENPPLYRTTYFGRHTCTDLLTASQFLPQEEDHTAPFSLINFASRPSCSTNSSDSGSSNDNSKTWSSFFTSPQSSPQQDYKNMNSDRDPNLIFTYSKAPSFSHYLVPAYDQTGVSCTISTTTTTPILKCFDFDENDNFLFYF